MFRLALFATTLIGYCLVTFLKKTIFKLYICNH